MDNKPKLTVSILSPQQILYQGPALSVSSKNSSGKFDILPEHANMVTFIENFPITLRIPALPTGGQGGDETQKKEFKFPMAIMYVTNNIVKVYAQPEIVQI